MIVEDYADKGLYYFTEPSGKSGASAISNTYAISTPTGWYIIDTSCGKKRRSEIREFLRDKKKYTILCTHYHNDHIANNGTFASSTSHIIYHHKAAGKIRHLRTNATGQILAMYNKMDRKTLLKSISPFSSSFINRLLSIRILSDYVIPPILFVASYIVSLRTIGIIRTGRRHIQFLSEEEKKKTYVNGVEISAWEITDGFCAFETPGHTDCHISFFFHKEGILFTGDALNILTPNDIRFGEIEDALNSQRLLENIAKSAEVATVCSGHYPPVSGAEIIDFVKNSREKHEHLRKTLTGYLSDEKRKLPFSSLYKDVLSMEDPLIRKLSGLTFPRSTLVFLDVYLLKIIMEINERCNKNSLMEPKTDV